jgi:hypothetical protein
MQSHAKTATSGTQARESELGAAASREDALPSFFAGGSGIRRRRRGTMCFVAEVGCSIGSEEAVRLAVRGLDKHWTAR